MKRRYKAGLFMLFGGLLVAGGITGNVNINKKKKFDEKLLAATAPTLPDFTYDKYAKWYFGGSSEPNIAYADSNVEGTGFISTYLSTLDVTYDAALEDVSLFVQFPYRFIEGITPAEEGLILAISLPNKVFEDEYTSNSNGFGDQASDTFTFWGTSQSTEHGEEVVRVLQPVGTFTRIESVTSATSEGCADAEIGLWSGHDNKEVKQLPNQTASKPPDTAFRQTNFAAKTFSNYLAKPTSTVERTVYQPRWSTRDYYCITTQDNSVAIEFAGDENQGIEQALPEGSEYVNVSDPKVGNKPVEGWQWVIDPREGPRILYYLGENAEVIVNDDNTMSGLNLSGFNNAKGQLSGQVVDLRNPNVAIVPQENLVDFADSVTFRYLACQNFSYDGAYSDAELNGLRYKFWDNDIGNAEEYYRLFTNRSVTNTTTGRESISCEGSVVSAGKHRVRPTLTMNTDSVFFVTSYISGKETTISNDLTSEVVTNMRSGVSKKMTLKDSTQGITGVTGNSTDTNILGIEQMADKKVKIKVRKGTSAISLKVDGNYAANGGKNYVTQLGIDVTDSNKVKIGRLATKANSGSTDITLGLQKIIADRNTIGNSAKVNLYTEELNDPYVSNTIAETPYEVEVVIVEDQKIAFDSATKTALAGTQTYGDAMTITAQMPDAVSDPSSDAKFSLEGTNASSYASITNQKWDTTTRKLTATLTFLKPGASDLKLKVSKAGSDLYTACEESVAVSIRKRKISLTVNSGSYFVGEPFDVTKNLSITSELLNESGGTIAGTAIVSGDTSPYSITLENIADSSKKVIPVTNGRLDQTAVGDWKILLQGNAAAIKTFGEKYEVSLKDYLQNASRIISVKPVNFRAITNTNFTKHPLSATVYASSIPVTFSAKVKYPITREDGVTPLTSQEQQLSYKVQRKLQGAADFVDVDGGTIDCNDTLGIATITYELKSIQSSDDMSVYRMLVWNKRNQAASASDKVKDYAAISHEAVLKKSTDPEYLIQVPRAIEVSDFGDKIQDAEISDSGEITKTKSEIRVIGQLLGKYEIRTDPIVNLSVDGGKASQLQVVKSDGTKLVSKDDLLTEFGFSYNTQVDTFSLIGSIYDFKEAGTYKGYMTFNLKASISPEQP